MTRRPDGALEADVLSVLWRADEPMTAAAVREQLPSPLAYTTVMTVLARLFEKGRLTRTQQGRAYAYSAVLSESEFTARGMAELLASARDRASALTGFVGELSKRDAELLRRVVRELDKP